MSADLLILFLNYLKSSYFKKHYQFLSKKILETRSGSFSKQLKNLTNKEKKELFLSALKKLIYLTVILFLCYDLVGLIKREKFNFFGEVLETRVINLIIQPKKRLILPDVQTAGRCVINYASSGFQTGFLIISILLVVTKLCQQVSLVTGFYPTKTML